MENMFDLNPENLIKKKKLDHFNKQIL